MKDGIYAASAMLIPGYAPEDVIEDQLNHDVAVAIMERLKDGEPFVVRVRTDRRPEPHVPPYYYPQGTVTIAKRLELSTVQRIPFREPDMPRLRSVTPAQPKPFLDRVLGYLERLQAKHEASR